MAKIRWPLQSGRLKTFGFFVIVCILYSAWMTGCSFKFTECSVFPNYNLLAQAFSEGRLSVENTPPDDTLLKEGRRYIFSGPVPALLRLPTVLLFGRGIPTGFMIVVFCAGVSVLILLILNELSPPPEVNPSSRIKKIFMLAFVFNGISLFMVSIPSIHHESISAATFFLTISIYLLLKIKRKGFQFGIWTAVIFAVSLSFSVGSRYSSAYAAALLGGVFIFGVLKKTGGISLKEKIVFPAILFGIGVGAGGCLLWYNYARFGTPFDFGVQYITSFYRDYFHSRLPLPPDISMIFFRC